MDDRIRDGSADRFGARSLTRSPIGAQPEMATQPPSTGSLRVPVLVMRAELAAGLSDLPVVGPHVPADLDLWLTGLDIVAVNTARRSAATEVNNVLDHIDTDRRVARIPEEGLPNKFRFGVVVTAGGRRMAQGAPDGAGPSPSRGRAPSQGRRTTCI
ncbi:hypothetical protein JOF56_007931 [Kibdelosporangium banguiense]|uniref:Uncharacterized protein n=1 Tax=Kibdelosporangium banguiense TaxID=1365924 RepID=A0ABS4TT10_9PSEU|nr:hypothetical protein [Kibdelosporangium banguiense]